jgi:uncharacterized protein involved in exopolysaccharide biosynthesis
MEDLIPQTSARDLAFVLWKRRWSIIFILVGTLVGTLVWLLFIREDLYAVTARVLVKIGREQAPPPTVLGASPLVVGYRTSEVNSEMEVFTSSELINQLIDELKLDQPGPPSPMPDKLLPRIKYRVKAVYTDIKEWYENVLIAAGLRERLTERERVFALLQQGVAVKAAKDSNVFVAVLATPYRKGSSFLFNKWLDKYLVYRQRLYANGEFDFFRDVVNKSLGELRGAETHLQEFENAESISLLPKQEEQLIEQLTRERAFLREAQMHRDESLLKVQKLDAELKKDDPNFGVLGDFPRDSFQQNILTQLADLQRDREKLRMKEFDSSDHVKNNRNQFGVLVSMLGENLRAGLTENEAIVASRQRALAELESDLSSNHGKTQNWTDLKRRVADLEGSYLTYRKKLTETAADADMERQQIGNVAILERAVDPIEPVGMRKTTLIGIALLVGIFTALAWVALAEFFDHKVYTEEDVRRHLGVPVLAVIPARKG